MRTLLPFAACLLAVTAVAQKAPLHPYAPNLLLSAQAQDPMLVQAPGILRSRAVRVDLSVLARVKKGDVLRVELFKDKIFFARFEEREDFGRGHYSWTGRLDDREQSLFVLSVDQGAVAGSFTHASHEHPLMVELHPGRGTQYVREVKQDRRNSPIAGDMNFVRPMASGPCDDNPNRIRIMVLYGRGAVFQAAGVTRLRAWITSQVSYMNAVFGSSRSNTGIQFVLTSIRDTGYTSQTNMSAELGRLRGKSDGFMDQIHAWRDADKADIVALILQNNRTLHPRASGIAYYPASVSGVHESLGFNITEFAQPSNVFTQEVCHNFGCHHEPANSVPVRIYPYAQAHSDDKNTGFPFYARTYFTTVVGYPTSRRPIIPYLSSPLWTFKRTYTVGPDGPVLPMGTAALNDNRRSIGNVKQLIANFRKGDRVLPRITRNPVATNRCLGYQTNSAIMSIAATGAASYQWRRNGANLSGQTSSTLRFSSLTAANAGAYDCVVTGVCPADKVTSARVNLTVGPCRVFRYSGTYDRAIAAIGDFDNDGYQDWATGETSYGTGGTVSGVRWYSGRTHAVQAWGRGGSEENGTSLAGADVNGDDYSDIVVGAPGYSSGRGRVIWQSGKNRALYVFATGSVAGGRFGQHVTVGRFDAAANPDAVIAGKDKIYCHSSSGGRLLWTATPFAGANVTALITLGDVNNDGYDDIVVGASGYNSSGGLIDIRSGRNGARIRAYGFGSGIMAGHSLAPLGDVNGDGIPDYVFTAPKWNNNGGWISVRSGAANNAQLSERLGNPGQRIGWAVAPAGADYNNDGALDFLASEIPTTNSLAGTVRVLSSKNAKTSLVARTGSNSFGMAIAGLDTNGDSLGDQVVLELGKLVWAYDRTPKGSPPAFTIYGRAGPGSGGRIPRIDTGMPLPRIAGKQVVTLHGARANSAAIFRLGFVRANVPLDAVGITGGSLLMANILVDWVRPTNSQGKASFTLPLSTDPKYTGLKLNWQCYVLDIGGNSFGLTASDGGEMRIGAR